MTTKRAHLRALPTVALAIGNGVVWTSLLWTAQHLYPQLLGWWGGP
jgi:hypothetical protein